MTCFSPIVLYKSKAGPDRVTGRWPLVPFADGYIDRPVEVPCGYCVGCRLERARQWSLRLYHEGMYHEDAYFITLTYSDTNIKYGNEVPTLVKSDLQKFWKRLRKHFKKRKIKYFACGEYGDNTMRPHYHAIVFGFPISDLVLWRNDLDVGATYTSALLDSIWKLGRVIIGAVTPETTAYVARYTIKKQYGVRALSYYGELGIEPEFVCMSKGVGEDFFHDYKDDIYNQDVMIHADGVTKGRPPKYYDKLLDKYFPDRAFGIVADREKKARKFDPNKTKERLAVRESIKKSHMNKLKRGKV